MDLFSGPVDQTSSSEAKIALFRSLFRGRDDVYPRRFESRKTGKAGLCTRLRQRVGARDLREAPDQVRRLSQPRFLPVTDEVIRWHLSGQDADGQRFRRGRLSDAAGRDLFLPRGRFRQGRLAARMRSRSWKPAGVWISPRRSNDRAPATAATSGCSSRRPFRRRWRASSAPTSSPRPWSAGPDIGLDSYDRFFPNQDTLPKGGFGNLIALPLQKRAARAGKQRLSR